MSLLLHIVKFKILTFIKLQGGITLNSILKNLGTSSVYLLFAVGIYFFAENIISYLLEDVKIGIYLLHRFIFIFMFIFFLTVNIGNIVVSYSTFFKTREVSFLLTNPISFTKIFLIKFFDNFFYSSSTLLLIVTAAISAYVSYFGLQWYIIPLIILFLIFPFMLIAGTLGAIILLVILRFAATLGIKKVTHYYSFSLCSFNHFILFIQQPC